MERFRDVAAALQFSAEKMKKSSLFSSERFFCDAYGLEPGQSQTRHRHAGSDKVYYVLHGRGDFRVDEESRTIDAGGIVYCPAGSEHGVTNPGPGRLSLLVFMAPLPK